MVRDTADLVAEKKGKEGREGKLTGEHRCRGDPGESGLGDELKVKSGKKKKEEDPQPADRAVTLEKLLRGGRLLTVPPGVAAPRRQGKKKGGKGKGGRGGGPVFVT